MILSSRQKRQTKRSCARLIFSHVECRLPGHRSARELSHPQTHNSRSTCTNLKNAPSSSLLSFLLPSPASQPHPMSRPPASFQMSTFHFPYWPTYFSPRIVDKSIFISSVLKKKISQGLVFFGFDKQESTCLHLFLITQVKNISAQQDNTNRRDSTPHT